MTNAGGGRAEEQRRADDIVGSATRPSGIRSIDLLAERRIVEPVPSLGADDRRRDAVDGDAVPRELHRVLLHQHDEAALGAAVRGVAAIAQAELRAHRQQMNVAPAALARRPGGARRPAPRNIAALRLTS